MPEDEAGRALVPWRSSPILARLTRASAHLSGAVLLAAGVATTLAARRDRNDDAKRDAGNGKHDRNGERVDRKDRDDSHEDRDKRGQDRDVRRDQKDASGNDRNRDQNRKNDDNDEDADSDAGTEQTNNGNQNNRNRDDEPNNNENTNDGGGDRNNAGSGFFDDSLATKARRRAREFDNRGQDEEAEDGIVVDVNPERESVYQTESISFATGPEGVEILTRNITYTAAPTPTPTPIPRLELPERDGYPFGEDFPFGVARPTRTPTTAAPADEAADPGDSPPSQPEPAPTEPLPGDTDGGDNSTDFAS